MLDIVPPSVPGECFSSIPKCYPKNAHLSMDLPGKEGKARMGRIADPGTIRAVFL